MTTSEKYLSQIIGLIGDISVALINNLDKTKKQDKLKSILHFLDPLLDKSNDDYIYLIKAIALYLCNEPQKAKSCLKNKKINIQKTDKLDKDLIKEICNTIKKTNPKSSKNKIIFGLLQTLRADIYKNGTPRNLLLIDVLYAIKIIKGKQ